MIYFLLLKYFHRVFPSLLIFTIKYIKYGAPISAVTIPTLISLGANTILDSKSLNVKKQAPAKNEDF